jgi:hypothetical protein
MISPACPLGLLTAVYQVSSHLGGFQGTYPSNLFFHQHDLRAPFQERFKGTFDIINIRVVQLGLRGNDWGKPVEDMVTLLSESVPIFPLSVPSFNSSLLQRQSCVSVAAPAFSIPPQYNVS